MEELNMQIKGVATDCQGVVQVGHRQTHIVINMTGSFF